MTICLEIPYDLVHDVIITTLQYVVPALILYFANRNSRKQELRSRRFVRRLFIYKRSLASTSLTASAPSAVWTAHAASFKSEFSTTLRAFLFSGFMYWLWGFNNLFGMDLLLPFNLIVEVKQSVTDGHWAAGTLGGVSFGGVSDCVTWTAATAL